MEELESEGRRFGKDFEEYRGALENRDFVAMANLAARYITGVSADHRHQCTIEHFGVCPQCLKTDGCYHVGRSEWFVCHEHRAKWKVGENLFSSWREMTDEQFQANAEMLAGYYEVEPIHVVEKRCLYPQDTETKSEHCANRSSEIERNTATKERYLAIEADIHRAAQQRESLVAEEHKLSEKMRCLKREHFDCVHREVLKLIGGSPQAGQVLVDIPLLKEVHDYFSEYETGQGLPSGEDVPF